MTALRDAVEAACAEAVEGTGDSHGLVVTEFIVIASAAGFDDEGNELSQVVVIPDGGSEHRMIGLVEHARIRMHADVLEVDP